MSETRVLYVDDEADIREVAEMSLGIDPDFVVKTCGSGAEALIVAQSWKPHLVLLDVMMPEMDGPETLERLRAEAVTAHIPVVFITARTEATGIDRFLSYGAVGVIAKPFDPMLLAQSARDYLKL